MSEFYKKPTDGVNNPKHSFFTVFKDGKSPFEEFCRSLTQKSDKDALKALYAMMDRYDANVLWPKSMMRPIRGDKSDRNDVYEFKKKSLRIYFALQKPNVLILLGGHKNDQDNDIETVFRNFNQLPQIIPDYEP